MAKPQLDEEAIFHIARGIPDLETRSAYLDQICAGDEALRGRVEALLEVHEQDQDFLKSAEEPPPTVDRPGLTERRGTTIGRYRLMEQIGEGGMGTVFVAQQERPIRRKVALKVVKPGMDSKAVVARFEAERQALAMMGHPNISKVLDAGTTESGRPYFAMELVKGIPISEYCDKNRLTIRERLDLFVQVCQAIQHAHQKGIIHRDIKPSNVLVTLHDGNPVPKVIDFGVAKALNTRLTDKTIYTEHMQIIGTLMYMSPEQAELSGLDVDTRSDIYSLGVLLYELLTGTTPFQKKDLDQAGFDEQRRLIREQEPQRASLRISSLGETATTIAEHRRTDAKKLHQQVRGDLDWIVMKALEKDRTRRYETASEFAADIQRFLSDEVIEARPPSGLYRLRKMVGRHRVALATASIVMIALLIGTTVSVWQWSVVVRQREAAIVAKEEAERQREVAIEAEKQKASALGKLLEELQQKAYITVMRGNREEALPIIRDAKLAGMSDVWEQILLGQLELYGGSWELAVEHLTHARILDKNSVAAQALLAIAYDLSGQQEEYQRIMEQLPVASACPENDRPFLANAQLHTDAKLAYGTLRLLPQEQDSALVRIIRADVETHLSMEVGDPELAESAIRHLEIARILMRDYENEYALGLDMCAHLAAIYLREGDSERKQRLMTEADSIASMLVQRSKNYLWLSTTAMFYRHCQNNPERACDILKQVVDNGGGRYPATAYASLLFELGNDELAVNVLGTAIRPNDPPVEDTPASVALATIHSFTGACQDRQIKAIYEGTSIANRKYSFWTPETILLFVQDSEYVGDKCDDALKVIAGQPDEYWNRNVILFIADRIKDDELITAAGSSQRKRSIAHYLTAMKCLTCGKREEGKEHLRECLRRKALSFVPDWSQAILSRIQREPNSLTDNAPGAAH